MEIIGIENKWNWGYCFDLICEGCGLCNVEFKDGTTWGYISGLVVHPSRQHQGIATRLMERAEEIVKEEGYDLVALSVEKQRKWVIEWYKRQGYEVYDEDPEYYYLRKNL